MDLLLVDEDFQTSVIHSTCGYSLHLKVSLFSESLVYAIPKSTRISKELQWGQV
jgi:hypothetical protein